MSVRRARGVNGRGITCAQTYLLGWRCKMSPEPLQWKVRRYIQGVCVSTSRFYNSLKVYSRNLFPIKHRDIASGIGRFLFGEHAWDQASRYLSMSLDALEDLFQISVTAHGRGTELASSGELSALLAYTLVRARGQDAARSAVDTLERGRARMSGDVVRRQLAQIAAAEVLTPDLMEVFRHVCDRLLTIALKLSTPDTVETETLETNNSSKDDAEFILAKTVRLEYEAVLRRIRARVPGFLVERDPVPTITRELTPRECLAYVANTPAGSLAVLVDNPHLTNGESELEVFWDEQLTSDALADLLEHRERALDAEHVVSGVVAAQSGIGNLGEAVHRAILSLGVQQGVLDQLSTACRKRGIRHLVLVPCGSYGFLPLHAALVRGSAVSSPPVSLQDIVRVSYAPSGRIWAACRERAHGYPGDMQSSEALVVSNPLPLILAQPLGGAEAEGREVRRIVGASERGRVVLNDSPLEGEAARHRAVLRAIRAHATSLTHLHFACHGLVDWTHPQRSGLVLANDKRLTINDVLDPAQTRFTQLRLAVLSACQTALPGTELPDEVVGLPSAWLQAGASEVIASLWPVSDAATVGLMRKSYELHLLDHLEPDVALWLAQRWLRNMPSWRQDCLEAGAPLGADGPTAPLLVGQLARAWGEASPFVSTIVADMVRAQDPTTQSEDDLQLGDDTGSHLLHWAAFAHFGA